MKLKFRGYLDDPSFFEDENFEQFPPTIEDSVEISENTINLSVYRFNLFNDIYEYSSEVVSHSDSINLENNSFSRTSLNNNDENSLINDNISNIFHNSNEWNEYFENFFGVESNYTNYINSDYETYIRNNEYIFKLIQDITALIEKGKNLLNLNKTINFNEELETKRNILQNYISLLNSKLVILYKKTWLDFQSNEERLERIRNPENILTYKNIRKVEYEIKMIENTLFNVNEKFADSVVEEVKILKNYKKFLLKEKDKFELWEQKVNDTLRSVYLEKEISEIATFYKNKKKQIKNLIKSANSLKLKKLAKPALRKLNKRKKFFKRQEGVVKKALNWDRNNKKFSNDFYKDSFILNTSVDYESIINQELNSIRGAFKSVNTKKMKLLLSAHLSHLRELKDFFIIKKEELNSLKKWENSVPSILFDENFKNSIAPKFNEQFYLDKRIEFDNYFSNILKIDFVSIDPDSASEKYILFKRNKSFLEDVNKEFRDLKNWKIKCNSKFLENILEFLEREPDINVILEKKESLENILNEMPEKNIFNQTTKQEIRLRNNIFLLSNHIENIESEDSNINSPATLSSQNYLFPESSINYQNNNENFQTLSLIFPATIILLGIICLIKKTLKLIKIKNN